VLKTLLEKRLIVTAGRKEVIGRPILYRTSRDFLMRFGLSDVDELPSLKEFEALAREALGADEGIAPMVPEIPSQADSAPAPGAPQEAPSSAEPGGSEVKAAAAAANRETAGSGGAS
jgi:segregation and condensation protein B